MNETPIAETPSAAPAAPVAAPEAPAAAPAAAPAPAAADPNDPFSVDESRLASFTPEQRSVLDEWKKKASEEIERTSKSSEEKYKPVNEKAQALDKLVKNPSFQNWWQTQQQAAMRGQAPDTQEAIAQTKPQDFASPTEWSEAVLEASNGDAQKLQAIQARMFATMATPVVKQLQEKQQMLETTMEMKNLFERHPDAKQLDEIGRDGSAPDDDNPSLLEIAMYYAVDQKGQTIEDGYSLAKKWSDSMGNRAKQQAMGIVQEKKAAVTAGQSSAGATQSVVEVEDSDELMKRHMEATLSGATVPKFVIRKK